METVEEAVQDISPADFKRFREIYENQVKRGPPSAKAQYDYAWCLVKSPLKTDMQHGILMLEDLFQKTVDEGAKRDYLFYLSVGHTRLKEYEKALKYCRAILKVEPRNRNAIHLREYIEKCMQKDGFIGMAIVGGAAVLAIGGLVGIGVALSRSSK